MPFPARVERDKTLSHQVSRQIQMLLIDGHLRPGDRLPSERHLALRFKVSRTAVREAVNGLAAKGMLDMGMGRGGTRMRAPRLKETQTITPCQPSPACCATTRATRITSRTTPAKRFI